MAFLSSKKFTSLSCHTSKKPRKLGNEQIPSDDNLLKLPTTPPARKRGRFVADLSTSSGGAPGGAAGIPKTKKKPKSGVYVASTTTKPRKTFSDIFDMPSDDEQSNDTSYGLLGDREEKDELLKDFDISRIKKDADKLISQIDRIKEKNTHKSKRDESSKYIQKLFQKAETEKLESDDIFPIVEKESNSLTHIYDDSAKSEEVRRKYLEKGFQPLALGKRELLVGKVRPKLGVAEDILNGKIGSYFYEIARKYSETSHRLFITDMEVINFPKQRHHGYIGAVRAHLISHYILESLGELLQQKRSNKVVQFWGINYFTRFVLTAEIIARIVAEEQGFGRDLDRAYDMMEATNNYGLYVMDKVDPQTEPQTEPEVESEEESEELEPETKAESAAETTSNTDSEKEGPTKNPVKASKTTSSTRKAKTLKESPGSPVRSRRLLSQVEDLSDDDDEDDDGELKGIFK